MHILYIEFLISQVTTLFITSSIYFAFNFTLLTFNIISSHAEMS